MSASFAGVPSVRAMRAQRLVIAVALGMVAVVSWIELAQGVGMEPGRDGVVFFNMWLAMVAAMMLPTIEPMVSAYYVITRELPSAQRAARMAGFVGPYLLLWGAAGLLALVLKMLAMDRPVVVATLVAAAGLYQLGALKEKCLRSCRSPLGFFLRYGAGGSLGGAVRLGFRHAALCFGCCAGLMAALAGVGAVELSWMAAVGLLMLLEKVHPLGHPLARTGGLVLLVLAPVTLVVPLMGPPAQLGGLVALGMLAAVALLLGRPLRARSALDRANSV